MKLRHIILSLFSLLLAAAASPVFAYHGDHSHVRLGFYISAPLWGPWDYPYYYPPYPYYYDARVVMTSPPPSPPSDVMPAPGIGGPTQQPYYRNYCPNLSAYYPQIRDCPSGWQLR